MTMIVREKAREDAARIDRERLQGVWNFVSGHREAKMSITGDRYVMDFRNGDHYEGTFTLDPTSRPRSMNMLVEEGPEHHRGKVALAIYEFDSNHLIWCPAEPGKDERMEAFPSEEDRDHLCIIFHRDMI